MDADQREAVARRSVEAWNADDWEEELKKLWKPDGAIVAPEGWPESGTFEGWSAMVAEWARIKDSWAVERAEAIEVESIRDRVLARVHWTTRGDASGAPLESEVYFVCEFDQDRISRMAYFLDREEARAAAEAGG
jgi:ketosteroid isomerase-like protein